MDKLLEAIEILHKSINNLLSIGVIDKDMSFKLANDSLDILINKEQREIRTHALRYYDELNDQNKGAK